MDWFPLYNSIRIAAVSTVLVFFLGDEYLETGLRAFQVKG